MRAVFGCCSFLVWCNSNFTFEEQKSGFSKAIFLRTVFRTTESGLFSVSEMYHSSAGRHKNCRSMEEGNVWGGPKPKTLKGVGKMWKTTKKR